MNAFSPVPALSGNVTLNGGIMHVARDDLPFGGASGISADHGAEGFRAARRGRRCSFPIAGRQTR